MARHVGEACPVQVARRRRPVGHLRQADVGPVPVCAVEMADEAH